MVRPVSVKGFQRVSDFPLGIMCLYQIPQLRRCLLRKRKTVFHAGVFPAGEKEK